MLRLRPRQFRKPESSLEFDLAPEIRRKCGHGKCARFSTPQRRLVDDDFELEARTPQRGSGLVLRASIYVLAMCLLCAAAASDQPRNACEPAPSPTHVPNRGKINWQGGRGTDRHWCDSMARRLGSAFHGRLIPLSANRPQPPGGLACW